MHSKLFYFLVCITFCFTTAELNKLVSKLDKRRSLTGKCARIWKGRQIGSLSIYLPPQDAPSWTTERSVDLTQQKTSARHTALDDSNCMRNEESSDSYFESSSEVDLCFVTSSFQHYI